MKLATLGLTTALVLTNAFAFAQSGTGSTGGAAAGGSTSSGTTTGMSGSTTGSATNGGLGNNAGSAAAGTPTVPLIHPATATSIRLRGLPRRTPARGADTRTPPSRRGSALAGI